MCSDPWSHCANAGSCWRANQHGDDLQADAKGRQGRLGCNRKRAAFPDRDRGDVLAVLVGNAEAGRAAHEAEQEVARADSSARNVLPELGLRPVLGNRKRGDRAISARRRVDVLAVSAEQGTSSRSGASASRQ